MINSQNGYHTALLIAVVTLKRPEWFQIVGHDVVYHNQSSECTKTSRMNPRKQVHFLGNRRNARELMNPKIWNGIGTFVPFLSRFCPETFHGLSVSYTHLTLPTIYSV